MEAKDEKRKVLQAIFSSVLDLSSFKCTNKYSETTHTQRNKKVSEPARETWWYKKQQMTKIFLKY